MTGREEKYRATTRLWLEEIFPFEFELFCRPTNDSRSDVELKFELYQTKIARTFEVVAVLDDRNRVVEMWRDQLGLTCLQVAPGDF